MGTGANKILYWLKARSNGIVPCSQQVEPLRSIFRFIIFDALGEVGERIVVQLSSHSGHLKFDYRRSKIIRGGWPCDLPELFSPSLSTVAVLELLTLQILLQTRDQLYSYVQKVTSALP